MRSASIWLNEVLGDKAPPGGDGAQAHHARNGEELARPTSANRGPGCMDYGTGRGGLHRDRGMVDEEGRGGELAAKPAFV